LSRADDPLFTGRVALVTGASGGIGRRIAERLAAEQAAVALAYGAHAEPARELADRIAGDGGRAIAVGADLRDAGDTERLADTVATALGPIDILVANAGLSTPGSYDEIDADRFDETLAVNLRAPFLLARRVLPGMRERGFGRILFTSSVAALTGGVIGPHYAASKAGLHALTHHLASRVAADGVTVNALAPALVEDTGMLPGDPGELRRLVPVGRLGRPEEVADFALAMLANGYLTSKVVALDGGMHPR
jgi:3-oxoacyl-[acyl-carrier protein] reductase